MFSRCSSIKVVSVVGFSDVMCEVIAISTLVAGFSDDTNISETNYP